MKFSIAIDGPAASGKSSTAEEVARKLGFQRIDSGLLYRAITWLVLNEFGSIPSDLKDEKVKTFIQNLKIMQKKTRTFSSDTDISEHLRTHQIDCTVGKIAKELYVRNKVLEIQKEAMKNDGNGIVIDGRDIGTVVIPNAFLKVFITASDITRAKRRCNQTGEAFEKVLNELRIRDSDDISREHGPLKIAKDAIVIENDNKTKDETVEEIIQLFNNKFNK